MTLKEFLISAFSDEDKSISFSRVITAAIVLYFGVQDAVFFHVTGHLIDNSTSATQLGWVSSLYGLNKVTTAFGKNQ